MRFLVDFSKMELLNRIAFTKSDVNPQHSTFYVKLKNVAII